MPHTVSPLRLESHRSGLLLVDLQEKLCPAIEGIESVLERAIVLTQACDELQIPRIATVQYPDGLGNLVEPFGSHYPSPHEKLDFSAAVCRTAIDPWSETDRDQVVLVGIETHICILQTALDLQAEGKQVYVVLDAVASRNAQDHIQGLERMRSCGIHIVSLESVLFEWLGSSRHASFRLISQMIKGLNPPSTP